MVGYTFEVDVDFDDSFFRNEVSFFQFSFREKLTCSEDINWLTGLNEPPQDVLDLLEFFLSRAPLSEKANKEKCFQKG